MEKARTGGPAFPCTLKNNSKDEEITGFKDGDVIPPDHIADYRGMSLRDYFAAKAVAALIAEPVQPGNYSIAHALAPSDIGTKKYAIAAYAIADAMIAARGE